MANKLYPPTIAGTLPAFYLEYVDKGAQLKDGIITVPFTMNAAVSETQIKGFSLRLRTASSGSYVLPPIYSNIYSVTDGEVTFGLTKSQAQNLNEGQYYKIQLAYCGSEQYSATGELIGSDIGYYSTVGVAKCTSKPKVTIMDLSYENVNSFQNELFGLYDLTNCNDQTEKVYSYEFRIYNEDGSLFMTSGEQLHKAYYDTDYTSSIDKILLNDFATSDKLYSIEYKVTTLNGLVLSSPRYKITSQFLISPNAKIEILPEADQDNGIINVHFSGAIDTEKSFYYFLDIAKLKQLEVDEYEHKQILDASASTITQAAVLRLNGLGENKKLNFVESHALYRHYYIPSGYSRPVFYYAFGAKEENTLVEVDGKYYYPDVASFIGDIPIEGRGNYERYEKIIDGKDLLVSYSFQYVEDNFLNINDKNSYEYLTKSQNEKNYYGSYLLSRASDEDNYQTWYNIARFRMEDIVPSNYTIKDVAIEHGRRYKYGLQQYNIWGLYSSRIVSDIFEASFEDMFLYDGEKTLRIRYNPEVSSFKTTLLEQKTDTIGGRFPFMTRNGATYYKEFPIAGLLAAETDTALSFIDPENGDVHRHSTSTSGQDEIKNAFRNYHDFSDSNIALERNFKLKVLEWLNNGKPKLFKSPYEGNYIIRLMNNSLTPVKELGRMLHNFSSTAYEIAEYSYENLLYYKFLNVEMPSTLTGQQKSFDLSNPTLYNANGDAIISLDTGVQQFTVQDMMPGDMIYLTFANQVEEVPIMIGVTGSYTYTGTENNAKLIQIRIPQSATHDLIGSINTFYDGVRITDFDSIIGMKLSTIISQQYIGVNPWMEIMKRVNWDNTNNYGNRINTLSSAGYEELHDYNFRTFLNGQVTEQGNGPDVVYYVNDNFVKLIRSFDPGELLDRINLSIHQNEKYKTELLNLEMIRFRERPLIPVYTYTYPKNINLNIEGQYENRLKEKTINNNYPYFLVSTSPYGTPYPIDELLETEMLDPFCMFQINRFKDGEWQVEQGEASIYDPYYRTWTHESNPYDPTVKIGYKWKTVIYLNEEDLQDEQKVTAALKQADYILYKVQVNNDKFYFYYKKNNHTVKINEYQYELYTQYNDNLYVAIGRTINYNTIYYVKDYDTILNLSTEKYIEYNNMPLANSYHIGNGVIAELTFQIRVVDYYTEIYNDDVRLAKEAYLEAKKFYSTLVEDYNTIVKANKIYLNNLALTELYSRILNGNTMKLAEDYKDIIKELQAIEYFNYLDLYRIYTINNYLSLPPINSEELIQLLVDKKIEYRKQNMSDEEVYNAISKLELYKYNENGINFYYVVDPEEKISNYNEDLEIDEDDIALYRFQNQNTKEIIYYTVYNHDKMIEEYVNQQNLLGYTVTPENLIVMYNSDEEDEEQKYKVIDKTDTAVLIKGKYYQLERIMLSDNITPAQSTRDYMDLLNEDEYAALRLQENFIYAYSNKEKKSDKNEALSLSNDLIEEDTINIILEDKDLEGINHRIEGITSQIADITQQLNSINSQRTQAIENYAQLYQNMVNNINKYNDEVYKSWVRAVFLKGIEIKDSDGNPYIVELDGFPNAQIWATDYLEDQIEEIQEELQSEFEYYILLHYAIDYLYGDCLGMLKTIRLNNTMEDDLNNDQELDSLLESQIALSRGQFVLNLLAIKEGIKQQIDVLESPSNIFSDTENGTIDANKILDLEKYNFLLEQVKDEEDNFKILDNEIIQINSDSLWLKGIKKFRESLLTEYTKLSISVSTKSDIVAVAELSNYYDDINFLIEKMSLYTNQTIQSVNIDDPINIAIAAKYDANNIELYNSAKELEKYYYRKRLRADMIDYDEEEEEEFLLGTPTQWADKYLHFDEESGKLILNDEDMKDHDLDYSTLKEYYPLRENPFTDFIFNPQLESTILRDSAFKDITNNSDYKAITSNYNFYKNLKPLEKQNVLLIFERLINIIQNYESDKEYDDTIDTIMEPISNIIKQVISLLTISKPNLKIYFKDHPSLKLSTVPANLKNYILEKYDYLIYYDSAYLKSTDSSLTFVDNVNVKKTSRNDKIYEWKIPYYLNNEVYQLTTATYNIDTKIATISDEGIYYEYVKTIFDKEIENLNKLLEQANRLLSLYLKLKEVYDIKLNEYEQEYEYNYALYSSFAGTEAFSYYQKLNSDNLTEKEKKQLVIDYKNQVKKAWWIFLNLLDIRYSAERERGMYV